MIQQPARGGATLGSADLDSYVARFLGARKAFLILAVVTVLPELLRAGGPRPVMIALILLPAAVGLHAVGRYQRHPTSARALLWMVDACGFALSVQLPLILVLGAGTWAHNFWLYQRYWYAYVAAAALSILGFALYAGRRNRGVLAQQAGMLRGAAATGHLDAQRFYDILTLDSGAREVLRNWTAARYRAILGPMSVATLVVVLTTGGDGMVYLFFLMTIAGVAPALVVAVIRRRLLAHRGLGARDIELTPY